MIFPHKVTDTIVKSLIQYHSLSTKDLYNIVSAKVAISFPNFYKVVNALIEKQVCIRQKSKITLTLARIQEFTVLAQQVQHIPSRTAEESLLRHIQGRHEIRANSLFELDGAWRDTILQMQLLYDDKKERYWYIAHPYHILGMYETESDTMHYITQSGRLMKTIIGNTTPLDSHGEHLLRDLGAMCVTIDKHPFEKEGYFLHIYGNHIIEVHLPELLKIYFQTVFQVTSDVSLFKSDMFAQIFHTKADCLLTVVYDPKRASKLKKTMDRLFLS